MSGPVPSGRPRGRPRKDAGRPLVVPATLPFGSSASHPQVFHHNTDMRVGDIHEEDVECNQMEEDDELLVQKKKEIKRSWREEWKVQHKWVYPIRRESGELRLKCHWCTMYNMDNVFAKEGCSTIQLSALNTHAKSEAHKTAESRWESSDAAMTALNVPDNLWDFGGKAGASDVGGEAEAGDGMDEAELNGAGLGRKRKVVPPAKTETLGSILQKNNSRIVEVLLEAENGRNKRHAVDVGLLKKHYALEDQRQRLDAERLQFERARMDAVVQLGQQYNAALANIGNGLMKIGAALESKKN